MKSELDLKSIKAKIDDTQTAEIDVTSIKFKTGFTSIKSKTGPLSVNAWPIWRLSNQTPISFCQTPDRYQVCQSQETYFTPLKDTFTIALNSMF